MAVGIKAKPRYRAPIVVIAALRRLLFAVAFLNFRGRKGESVEEKTPVESKRHAFPAQLKEIQYRCFVGIIWYLTLLYPRSELYFCFVGGRGQLSGPGNDQSFFEWKTIKDIVEYISGRQMGRFFFFFTHSSSGTEPLRGVGLVPGGSTEHLLITAVYMFLVSPEPSLRYPDN